MIEITVKVPKDVKDIVSLTGDTLYVEALNQVTFQRISYLRKQLRECKEKLSFYENKYNKTFHEFSFNVPDTVEGHDDWIEWTYFANVADGLSKKIDRLSLLKG